MLSNRGFFAAALGLALFAGRLEAQERAPSVLSVEPYIGAFQDAYDIGADGNTGALVGVRAAYDLGGRSRLVGNLAFGSTSDVASVPTGTPSYTVYGNRWLMTTAGAEYDVHPGRTAVALGLQVGAGWRQVRTEDQVGNPTNPGELASGNYAFYDVVVPSLSVRHALTPRASVVLGVSDYVFDMLEWEPDHSPALSLGVSLR